MKKRSRAMRSGAKKEGVMECRCVWVLGADRKISSTVDR